MNVGFNPTQTGLNLNRDKQRVSFGTKITVAHDIYEAVSAKKTSFFSNPLKDLEKLIKKAADDKFQKHTLEIKSSELPWGTSIIGGTRSNGERYISPVSPGNSIYDSCSPRMIVKQIKQMYSEALKKGKD